MPRGKLSALDEQPSPFQQARQELAYLTLARMSITSRPRWFTLRLQASSAAANVAAAARSQVSGLKELRMAAS